MARVSTDSKLTAIENQVNRLHASVLSLERVEIPTNSHIVEEENLQNQKPRDDHFIDTQLERIIEKMT